MTSVIERKTRGQVRFLRLPEVLARTGLSRSTVYVWLDRDQGFPEGNGGVAGGGWFASGKALEVLGNRLDSGG